MNGQSLMEITTRKAAKEHKCYECQGVIKKGDKYDIHSGRDDNGFYEYKWCNDCTELYNKAAELCSPHDIDFSFGELRAWAEETIDCHS